MRPRKSGQTSLPTNREIPGRRPLRKEDALIWLSNIIFDTTPTDFSQRQYRVHLLGLLSRHMKKKTVE